MEHAVPLHRGSGRPAAVDYCVVLRQDEGNVIGVVPAEAKAVIKEKHVKQLSAYMWKIGTSKEYKERCVVGLLMDRENYNIAFTPLVYPNGNVHGSSHVCDPSNLMAQYFTFTNSFGPKLLINAQLLTISKY